MTVDLSIVIPSHNRPDLLRVCLTSVLRRAPPATEVLVVDDASPQGAARAVAQQFDGVRVIRSRRGGFCAAANSGIQAARGQIVELLNDDTEVTAGWAGAALGHFFDPKVAAVAPLVLFTADAQRRCERIDSAGDHYYVGGVAGKRGHGERLGPAYGSRRRVFGASASSAFYRRAALLGVGSFPEEFGAYFEDVDLAFRLHRAGYHVVFEPLARVYHLGASSYGARGRGLLAQQSLNEERVFWRNLPSALLLRALPRHLAVLAGKTWRRWQEGDLAPFLCGRLRLLGEIPALLRHRGRLRRWNRQADWQTWELDESLANSVLTRAQRKRPGPSKPVCRAA